MDNNIIQAEPVKVPVQQLEADKKTIKIKVSKKSAIIIGVIVVVVAVLGVLAYRYKSLLIAATVDGSPIYRLSVIQKLEKDSGKSLLDSLVTQKLVQVEANAKKIVVTDDEVSAEIKKIESQVTAQGTTLEAALAAQKMSLDDLKKQILLQLEMQKLVADKTTVTEAEVAQYITDNKVTVPKGQEAATNEQIKGELSGQKLNNAAQALITDLKAKAKIQYFVNY